jgi:NDP-sugar pyrophosphorylase family protein
VSENITALQRQLHSAARRRPKAVVLAGGKGTRLAPYTSVLPKPLMPVGDRSILEVVLGQLAGSGITDVTLCVGYLSHLIEAVLENSPRHGVNVTYVHEEDALGTAGPLRLVDGLTSTFIAMNGDVLTTLDYRALLRFHRENDNVLTIATRDRPIQIDYGVLHLGENGSSHRVREYAEKPRMTSTVSMGIYALEPRALEYIPPEGYFDFPDLVQALLQNHESVGAYRYDGLWFDIGRRDDYEQAVSTWAENVAQNGNGSNGAHPASGTNGPPGVHQLRVENGRGG